MTDAAKVFISIVMFAFIFAGITSVAYTAGRNSVQKKAVEQGVAEWVVIDPNGNTRFEWKP